MSLDKMADDFVSRKLRGHLKSMSIVRSAPKDITSLKGIRATSPTADPTIVAPNGTVTADNNVSSFIQQLTSYIPAEVVGAYVTIVALVPTPSWVAKNSNGVSSKALADAALYASQAARAAGDSAKIAASSAHSLFKAFDTFNTSNSLAAAQTASSAADAANASSQAALYSVQQAASMASADASIDLTLGLTFLACLLLAPFLQYWLIVAKSRALGQAVGRGPTDVPIPLFPIIAAPIAFVAWAIYLPNSIVAHVLNIPSYGANAAIVVVSVVVYALNVWLNARGLAPAPPAAVNVAPTVQRLSNGASIVIYPCPPAGFDPMESSDDELAFYGLPPRPDDASARERWQLMFGGPSNYVLPTFSDDEGIANNASVSNGSSINWSGAVIHAPVGSFKSVQGQFVVPTIDPNGPHGEVPVACFWIGLDGAPGSGTDVFQVGVIYENFPSSSNPLYRFFCQWRPGGMNIVNGPDGKPIGVESGDTVALSLNVQTSAGGIVSGCLVGIRNVSRALAVSGHVMQKDPGANSTASSAEWIAECPQINFSDPTELADFGSIRFDLCDAILDLNTPVPINTADLLDLADGATHVTAQVLGPNSIVCTFDSK